MRQWIWFVFCIISLLPGCQKPGSSESFTETRQPVYPDYTTTYESALYGFVVDENNQPLAGVQLYAGGLQTTTNALGFYQFNSAAFKKAAGTIKAQLSGYLDIVKSIVPIQGKQIFVPIQMKLQNEAGTLPSGSGGRVSLSSGASVSLPANSVVLASNSAPYSGIIHVSLHWLNPAEPELLQWQMPGDLRGIDSAGELKLLASYGMLGIELHSDLGEKLQLASGKTANLVFPITSQQTSTAPSRIQLWYFDEIKGLWIQEGYALRNGNNYQATVKHFSFWNCDIGLPMVPFQAQFTDESLHPLQQMLVRVSVVGDSGLMRWAWTDTAGFVYGYVPAQQNLRIELVAPCNTTVPITTLQTTSQPVDLGTQVVNTQNFGVRVTGTVMNCNGFPVTNGYVTLRMAGRYYLAETNATGGFQFTGLSCPGGSALITAFDRLTSQQATQITLPLSTGINQTGVITACNVVNTERIYYQLDNTAYELLLPQHLFGGIFDFAGNTTTINAVDLLNGNSQVFNMVINGADAPGTYPIAAGTLQLRGANYTVISGGTVTISEYGLIGEYIKGSFSGTIRNSSNGTNHTIDCTFSVKRDN